MRFCNKCKESKPINDFYQGKNNKYRCIPCINQDSRNHYKANAARYIAKARAWTLANKVRIRDLRLKRSYGLSRVDFDNLFKMNNGCCWICDKHNNDCARFGLHVDHCHVTGKVRGLLCSSCNTALGKFGTKELLLSAFEYLKKAV
jgi:hypothetical protein